MPARTLTPRILTPYVAVHVLCLGVFWTGISATAIAACLATYAVRVLLLGLSYHRYFAHRSFRTSRPMQCVLAIVGAFGLEGGPLWWAATHRHHHRHADTPDDLHSPRYHGVLYAHSGWFADRRHQQTALSAVADLARYPELVWIERHHPLFMATWFVATYLVGGWAGVFWCGCVSSVLVWHITHAIQSVSHCHGGYRRFVTPDESRNHLLVGFLSLGEWHNNHHSFPGSARQGFAWWEIDLVYAFARLLAALGLIWDLQIARPVAAHTSVGV
jgi:stearoyl-CoA desaturase (Delta-9 desaturase)